MVIFLEIRIDLKRNVLKNISFNLMVLPSSSNNSKPSGPSWLNNIPKNSGKPVDPKQTNNHQAGCGCNEHKK